MQKKILAAALPLALAAAYMTPALAQQLPAPPEAPVGEPSATGAPEAPPPAPDKLAAPTTVVVTGFRSSLQKALNLKQQAIGVRDSIVAEDIGKFPEANVAESLQRVPGVILNRDDSSGEGQRISIRGLPTEYSITTLNGAPVNTTSTSTIGSAARGFNYDVFASELFGRVDFYKSPLAELTEGGMGGVVDLQTPRPFDSPKRNIRYAISGAYNTSAKEADPTGFALYSNTWGPRGFLAGAAHSKAVNNRSGFEATGGYNSSANGSRNPVLGNFALALDYDDPRANLSGYSREQIDNALLPRIYRYYGSQNRRSRDGLVSSLQFKQGNLDLSLDGLYSQLENSRDELYYGLLIRNTRTTNRNAPPGTAGHNGLVPLDVHIDPSSNLLTGTFGNTSYSSGVTYGEDKTKFGYLALNGRWSARPGVVVTGQLSANNSKATSYSDTMSGQIFGVDSTIDYGDDHVYPSMSSTVDYTNPANFSGFDITTGWTRETDKGRQARLVLDYDYDLFGGWSGRLKTGLVYVDTSKSIEKRNASAAMKAKMVALGDASIRGSMVSVLPIPDLDMGPGWPNRFGTFNRDYVLGTYDPLAYNDSAAFTPAQSFSASEKVSTGFVQSDVKGQVLGRELRLNAGVRWSRTELDIDNFKRSGAGNAYLPNSEQGKYKNLLPAISAAYDLNDELIFRTSWGKTISRASLSIIAAQTVIPNPFDNTATAGNPNLKPQESKNFDTSLEWYFRPGSLLSGAYFKKKLSDATVSTTTNTTFGALGLPDSALGALFQDSSGRVDPNLPMVLRTYSNAGEQTLKGYEVAYQQDFTFLPDPFKGFGALASYTWIDPFNSMRWISNAGREIEVNSVPKYAYSVTTYYERGPLAMRLSYNYKDRSLHGDNPRNNGDDLIRWRAARGYLDGTISYKLSENLELRLDALNLTDTLAYDYFEDASGRFGSGKHTRMDYAKYDGRTIKIGIRGKL